MPYYLEIHSGVSDGEGEAFRLRSFSGHEELSRLFSFTLELESSRRDIGPEEIVGKPVSFSVVASEGQRRQFHGLVCRFSAGTGETGNRRYTAEVVPWLWFLTRTSDCRVFAKKKVPEILKAVFNEAGVQADFDDSKLQASYEEWDYCVQYRETDFNFVSRLMEQEGIYYYFVHTEDSHTLVLADSPSGMYDLDNPQVNYEYSSASGPQNDDVVSWSHQYQFIPGKYAHSDYNFDTHPPRSEPTPANLLLTEVQMNTQGKPETIDPQTYEMFDYPAEYEKKGPGKRDTQNCMEEEEAVYDVVSGSSYNEYFSPGARFTLQKHPSDAENAQYALTSVQHSAADAVQGQTGGQAYQNSFNCIPADIPFRPARVTRKPAINGVQTAVVVGPPGSEINTDKYGRVQVQFFWDRYNVRLQAGGDAQKKAEPVWIRVGQIIAGKQWGAMFIPRVGQEVMVTFEEGDPDRPLIAGVLYNAEQMPAYNPEQHATRSYIKTNSSLGGDGYNELRFEDKKGKEQIFIHAQRDMDLRVRNDSRERVVANRHLVVGYEKDGSKGGDQLDMVYRDKHLKIHRNQSEHIGGNMELLVGGIDGGEGNQDIVLKGTKKELVEKECHVHVKGKRSEKVDTDQSLTVGNNQQEKVGMKHALEAGQEIHLKSGMKVVVEAGLQLTLKVGGNFVDIGPAGVTIVGTLVNINSGGAAGAGSGSSPEAPQDAKEAKPTEAAKADRDKSGQKSTPF
jgi:type VI secretion system secreted protein VgrG